MQTVSLHGCRRVKRHAASAAGALFDKTLLDGLLGVSIAQTVQANSALGSRWLDGGVLAVGAMLDNVSFFLKQHEKGLKGVGFRYDAIYVKIRYFPYPMLGSFLNQQ